MYHALVLPSWGVGLGDGIAAILKPVEISEGEVERDGGNLRKI
jgi:hypothetical protein